MKRLFIVLNCLVLALAAVVLIPAFVLADVPGSYNSYGYATGVHAIGGSDAFPNFDHGAVNNRYPLAEVQQDASPSTTAVATYSDSGPLTATAGSQYNQGCTSGDKPPPSQICQNPNNSVPYAKATYPGSQSHSHIDSCNGQSPCPGAGADADAAQLNAAASGYYSNQQFSASGKTTTVMDQNGNLVVITHSEVQHWSMGPLEINNVVVDTNATSNLSGSSGDAHVQGGQVTFGGHPVSVTDQGVTLDDKRPIPCQSLPQPPPGPNPPPPPPPPPLPGGLGLPGGGSGGGSSGGSSGGAAGAPSGCVPGVDVTYFKVYTVAPSKKFDGPHATVWATGVHVLVTHPGIGPGVPTQYTEYVLGEGFIDAQAGSGGEGGFGLGGGFGDFGGGFGGFDQSGLESGAGANSLGSVLAANRIPLALMFLTLEALLLASAAAWVWSRSTPVEVVPDEVLSP